MKKMYLVFLAASFMFLIYPPIAWGWVNVSPCLGQETYDYNPLVSRNLNTVASLSCGYSDNWSEFNGSVATYGGDASFTAFEEYGNFAIEPMVHANASGTVIPDLVSGQGTWPAGGAGGSITATHRVVQVGNTSQNIDLVPVKLYYALHTSTNTETGIATANAYVTFSSGGILLWGAAAQGNNYDDSNIVDFMLAVGQMYEITATAGAGVGIFQSYLGLYAEAQAVADPFLAIDPSWEYAAYFMVQQQSNLNPENWLEVTRLWQNPPPPVPEPSTMLLLGSGLVGLVGYGRRRLKK